MCVTFIIIRYLGYCTSHDLIWCSCDVMWLCQNDICVYDYSWSSVKIFEAHGSTWGSPPNKISSDDVKYLLSLGISRAKVANILGVSRWSLYNRIKGCSKPEAFNRFSDLSDAKLDSLIRSIRASHTNDVEVMLAGHSLSHGVQVPRVWPRANIHQVDLKGTDERKNIAIKRTYHVSQLNEVWHIDGHHKLNRWRLHGGIHGYFHGIILLLTHHTDNSAFTVLCAFQEGEEKYGFLAKVHTMEEKTLRCDGWWAWGWGWVVITGSWAHNEHIERLWCDVHQSLVVTFENLF